MAAFRVDIFATASTYAIARLSMCLRLFGFTGLRFSVDKILLTRSGPPSESIIPAKYYLCFYRRGRAKFKKKIFLLLNHNIPVPNFVLMTKHGNPGFLDFIVCFLVWN